MSTSKSAAADADADAKPEPVELKFDPEATDENGFASVWSIASATFDGETDKTRDMAGRILGFLCKKDYPYVVVSSTDATYLDEWFERDKAILYNWKADAETTDAICQHAFVPAAACLSFLEREKFKPTANYSPRRADRVAWFQEKWGIG